MERQGSFMLLMLLPTIGATTSDTRLTGAPQDIVFCAATSSSMIANGPIEWVRAE